nr:PREDICTED: cardiotrophin-like cytokine factor 1 [Lepisosteus oculatus]
MRISGARHGSLALLLAAAVSTAHVSALGSAGHRSSIERTYELTKYLEHQLRDIKHTYLSYLGPPFSDPDFAPPRPNSSALALPSAATRFELWKGLENRARLLQNHRAYSLLLGAVRELAQSTVCPYLQRSLLHFCTGLDGLLGSISGLLTALGYPLPPTEPPAPGAPDPEGGDSEEGAGPLAWGGRRERGLSADRMWGAPLREGELLLNLGDQLENQPAPSERHTCAAKSPADTWTVEITDRAGVSSHSGGRQETRSRDVSLTATAHTEETPGEFLCGLDAVEGR